MSGKKILSYFDPTGILFGNSSSSQPRKQEGWASDVDVEPNDESGYYSSSQASNSEFSDAPLRFIIIRHGERVDVMFGGGWTKRAFNQAGQYYPFDPNMPPSLPPRAHWEDYDVDTPLTAKGLSQSWNVGNVLARYNLPVTACYSSPAFRSIQTADRILKGMGSKEHVPLRLELGLFECTSWYARSPIHFMNDNELVNGGFNVDTHYRSQVSDLRPLENEYQYYDRSKDAMKKIIKLHRKTGGTILLVAHAPSLEVLTRHLMNGQPRPERLAELAGKVDFCSMTVIERETTLKPWQFRYSLDDRNNWQPQAGPEPPPASQSAPQPAAMPSVAALQSPLTFANYMAQTPTAIGPFQFFPQQEAYPPYFVV